MSYSFDIQAATKEAAIDQAYEALNKVADQQPPHTFDLKAAQTAVAAFIHVLGDDDAMDVAAHVSGSVSVQGRQGEPQAVTSAGISVTVFHKSRALKVG